MLKTIALTITLALALAAFLPGRLASAQSTPGQPTAPSAQPVQPVQPGMEHMTGMMNMQRKMMENMNASDTRLDALVQQMNAATGDKKIAAMADVINELTRQRRTMRETSGTMHQHMMQMMMTMPMSMTAPAGDSAPPKK